MVSQVCSDTVYCQSLPWSDSSAFIVWSQVDSPDVQVRVKSFGWQLLKLSSAMCVDRRYFFIVLTFSCQASDHWNCWNFQSTYHRLHLLLLLVIFDSSCMIWKRKKCLYMSVLNSCLGLWKLLGAPRRKVLQDNAGGADNLSPDAEQLSCLVNISLYNFVKCKSPPPAPSNFVLRRVELSKALSVGSIRTCSVQNKLLPIIQKCLQVLSKCCCASRVWGHCF